MYAAAKNQVLLAVSVSMINLTIGAIYGAIEGYYGGWVDELLMRIVEIFQAFPFLARYTEQKGGD